jgi:2-oxoglutarate ferredoxin oxidoreductase subunit alpha
MVTCHGAEPWAIPDIDSLPKIDVTFATDPTTFMPYSRDEETLRGLTPYLEHRSRTSHRRH